MARLIRAERVGPAWLRGEVFDAKTEAAAVRARAERDAEDLRARAERAAEAVRAHAYAEGYAAGRAEAAKQLFDLSRLQSELAQGTEQQALRAVLLVSAELLGSTLDAEPHKIVDVLAPHLARMRRAQLLTLRLHPADAAWLEGHREALQRLYEHSALEATIELRPDPGVTRGGCVIETNLGELDARVETRLTLLAAALGLDAARPESAEPR